MNRILSLADLESFDSTAKRCGKIRRFLCPICGTGKPRDDAHRSLALNADTGLYICHRCKEKGRLKEKWTKQTFTPRQVRVAAALNRAFSVEPMLGAAERKKIITEEKPSDSQSKLERLQSGMKAWQATFSDSPAQAYLQSRGITAETSEAFGCGFAPVWEHWEKDKIGNWKIYAKDRRVVFPVTDRCGNVIAVHSRAIDYNFTGSAKISKGDKSLGLFQTPETLSSEIMAICEGPVDAMALYQCGLPAVALIGTSAGEWLLSALAFGNVFIATDNDQSGNQAADNLISDLRSRGARAVRLCPDDCKDWAEFLEKHGSNALRDLIKQKIADSFPYHRLIDKPASITREVTIEDVFSVENESGQLVINYMFAATEKYEAGEVNDFLLSMPTVWAYKTELALVEGIRKHSAGVLPNNALMTLTDDFIKAHLRSNSVSLPLISKDIPLLSILLKMNDNQIETITCNQIQSWIIREFWLRYSPEAEIGFIDS